MTDDLAAPRQGEPSIEDLTDDRIRASVGAVAGDGSTAGVVAEALVQGVAGLRAEVVRLRAQLADCQGDPVSGNPARWGHQAVIAGLREDRETAMARMRAAESRLATLTAERDEAETCLVDANATIARLQEGYDRLATLTEGLRELEQAWRTQSRAWRDGLGCGAELSHMLDQHSEAVAALLSEAGGLER